jgi:hypothetical protein
MPMLHDIQARFASAVTGGEATPAIDFIADDAPGAAARLAIYANHYRVTLIDALASTFPVVRRLVGPDFFAAAARAFIREAPPAGPCLFEYGADFPAFLARLPAAAPLPWLADVASLEWAINAAWFAPDGEAIDGEALARLSCGGDAAIALDSSCHLVASPFPIDRIWQAHQVSCDDIEPVHLDAGGVSLLVHRQGEDVGWLALNEAGAAFIAALLAGRGAGQSLACAGAGFDATPLLAALLAASLLVSPTRDGSYPQ